MQVKMATTLLETLTVQFNMNIAPAYQVCDFNKDQHIDKPVCRGFTIKETYSSCLSASYSF